MAFEETEVVLRAGNPEVLRLICDADEFNALRERLPRHARAGVAPATHRDVGLVVQAVRDDVPLATMYAITPADGDHSIALALLERSLRAAIA